jgi:hypothetical protein
MELVGGRQIESQTHLTTDCLDWSMSGSFGIATCSRIDML